MLFSLRKVKACLWSVCVSVHYTPSRFQNVLFFVQNKKLINVYRHAKLNSTIQKGGVTQTYT